MKGNVIREIDNFRAECWHFVVTPEMEVRISRIDELSRNDESSLYDWQTVWQYPDLAGVSTIEQPLLIPEWVILDIKSNISSRLTFSF